MTDKVVVIEAADRSYCTKTALLKQVNSSTFQGFEQRCSPWQVGEGKGGGHQQSKKLLLFLLLELLELGFPLFFLKGMAFISNFWLISDLL